jgi:hypothetical protein
MATGFPNLGGPAILTPASFWFNFYFLFNLALIWVAIEHAITVLNLVGL